MSCREVANLLIDSSNQTKVTKAKVLTYIKKFLIYGIRQNNQFNHCKRYKRYSNELFSPVVIPIEKILLFLTDAASYMNKATQQLKVCYPNLTQVICLAQIGLPKK